MPLVDRSRFIKVVDDLFWKHLTMDGTFKDIVSFKDFEKDKYLNELANNINHYNHNFNAPDILYTAKANGILRRIKVYNLADTAIYYYCLKEIQEDLSKAIKSIPGVFGGFKFTPDLVFKKKDFQNNTNYNPEYEKFAKNRFRKDWSSYQQMAKVLEEKKYDNYIHIDVAHFYDDINLDILERSVRNIVNGKEDVINLLFFFLRNSDRKDIGYIQSSVGIPQEDVGEMSRLLANFYLHFFDKKISGILSKLFNSQSGESWMYIRFADDMWFGFNSNKNTAYTVTQFVSLELQKIKLHINEKKLEYFNLTEYSEYWNFKGWEEIQSNIKNVPILIDLVVNLYQKKQGRWFSLYNYIIKTIFSDLNNLKYIQDEALAIEFIKQNIENPISLTRALDEVKPFYCSLVKKHKGLEKYIINYLRSDSNIYPVVEYRLLEILIGCGCEKVMIEFFIEYYFKSTTRDYQWYSRVLCTLYFFNNSLQLEENYPVKLNKILAHIKNTNDSQHPRERRYIIRFLYRLRDGIGSDILEKNYILPDDLRFKNYIRLRPGV